MDILYNFKLIESSSPLTKKPSTPFRVAALGIMEVDTCKEEVITESEYYSSKPNANSVLTLVNLEGCGQDSEVDTGDGDLPVTEDCGGELSAIAAFVGQVSDLGTDDTAVSRDIKVEDEGIATLKEEGTDSVVFLGVSEGVTTITITYTYEDGKICVYTCDIEVMSKGE